MEHTYLTDCEEVLHISGCKVILRYAEGPTPGAMSNLRNMLFDQRNTPVKAPKICGDTGNVG